MKEPSTGNVCPEPDTGTEGAGLPTLKEREAQRASRRTTVTLTIDLSHSRVTARILAALARIERRTLENEALYLLEHAVEAAYFPRILGGSR